MWVVCIDNGPSHVSPKTQKGLTIGKKYKIIDHWGDSYSIYNDFNYIIVYESRRFISLNESRNSKIESILNKS